MEEDKKNTIPIQSTHTQKLPHMLLKWKDWTLPETQGKAEQGKGGT